MSLQYILQDDVYIVLHCITVYCTHYISTMQNYENKVVELQVLGYRLRAFQSYRYVNDRL